MPSSYPLRFSIIIPVYNGESKLADSLKSIAIQTFTNYEIVVADGGSTDRSLAVIRHFQAINKDIRIKVLSEPDKGIYDAMNKALPLAEGEWLYFMGCDDHFCSPHILGLVADETAKIPADLIYGNVEGMKSKTRYVYDTVAKVLSVGIHHQSIFYRASLFRELGPYDLRFKIASDYHFTLRVFLNERYVTRYINLDIAFYGEEGYSSQHFDYKLFSGHYRLLASGHRVRELDDPQKCLKESIYCCLWLAWRKKNLVTAWSNLLYYVFTVKGLTLSYRFRTLLRMLKWTVTLFENKPV
jgi:glycosyltransferase involved in cell wall biosynthesis